MKTIVHKLHREKSQTHLNVRTYFFKYFIEKVYILGALFCIFKYVNIIVPHHSLQ